MSRVSILGCALAVTSMAPTARAQTPTVPGVYFPEWYDVSAREKNPVPPELRLINYFFARASVTNEVADPSGLKGVSLGPLGATGGSGTRVGGVGPAFYVEQRWIPVVEYSPHFVDGLASFRAQLEVDYVWGKSANTVQPNEGGGFNADQVNIQTKNVNVALYPTRDPDELAIIIGTQPVYDAPVDPTRTPLNDIIRTGYKLAYLGSDATGLSLFSGRYGHSRLTWIPLDSAQPDKADKNDPRLKFAWLAMADHEIELRPGTWLGGSLWYLRDDTKGDAFAYEGLVRGGPSSGSLASFMGTQPLAIDRPSGWVGWFGINGHHNIDYRAGPYAASGFVMYNGGRFTSNQPDTLLNKHIDVSGLAANLELGWRWGGAAGDLVTLEGMLSSGDKDPTDAKYTGPFTLNYYGLPGAVWFNHKTLILFPFTSTVNNYTGAVTDISNQGYGLRAVIATAAVDLVPSTVNLRLGVAHAQSAVTPITFAESTRGRGKIIGTEVNAELRWQVRYLMTLGLHVGAMLKGDFYAGETSKVTTNPWAAFTTFTWYAF
jgi:hypothetical protein